MIWLYHKTFLLYFDRPQYPSLALNTHWYLFLIKKLNLLFVRCCLALISIKNIVACLLN